MIYFLVFYFMCQFMMLAFFVHAYNNNDLQFDKENIFMAFALTALSPLGVMILMGVFFHDHTQGKIRRECNRITTKWENAARLSCDEDTWDWYSNPAKTELRQLKLRETISVLTDDELEVLVSVAKSTFELEKFVRSAVMDEIIDRELKKA